MKEKEATRLTRRSARSGRIARQAWERLESAGSAGDPAARTSVIRIATSSGEVTHPHRAEARAAVASWWAVTRDAGLRDAVRRHLLLADAGWERWVTAAMHGQLLVLWRPGAAAAVPRLLSDPDPAVSAGAEAAFALASEPILGELWRALEDGSPGLDVLTRNPNELSPATLEIAISRWARADGEWLLAAAMGAQTPAHVRPALLAACRERGLAPADPDERGLFYLLTGQFDRFLAVDPGLGEAVRALYATMSQQHREQLRGELVDSGQLDLVRLLAADGDVGDAGRDAVLRQLAARANWPELWRMTLSLPVIEAVAAIRMFDRWRPPDEHDRALFDRFARADGARLTTAGCTRVRRPEPRDTPSACAVSPDGSRLVVAFGNGGVIDEYALPGGERIAVHSGTPRWFVDREAHQVFLVHTGESIVVGRYGGSGTGLFARVDRRWRDYRDEGFGALAPIRDGFVATVRTSLDTVLLFGTRDGRLRRRVWLTADLGLDPITPWALATHPDTGSIALGRRELIVLDADAGRVLARAAMPATLMQVAFTGPGSIVTTDFDDMLTRWRFTGSSLAPSATTAVPESGVMSAIPMHNRIELWAEDGQQFRDAVTLAPARPPLGPGTGWSGLWCSPVGGHVAFNSGFEFEVHDPIAVLARRPLGETTPSDLAFLEREIVEPGTPRSELAELLRACLHHRFGSDIALGSRESADAGPDIALGGG